MSWNFLSNREIGSHRGGFTSTQGVSDLDVRNAGEEVCRPRHRYAGVQDRFIIHLVLSGKGRFEIANRRSNLTRGNLFFIPSGAHVDYQADDQEPWHYTWVGFSGQGVGRMGKMLPILLNGGVVAAAPHVLMKGAFGDLLEVITRKEPGHELRALSIFFQMMSLLPGTPQPEAGHRNHVKAAEEFLIRHHAMEIDVGDVSKALGLDRTYLSALYRRTTGSTLAEALENLRLERSKKLLRETDLSVGEVGRSAGYGDGAVFMKMWKRRMGVSPGKWRSDAAGGVGEIFRGSDPSPYSLS